MPNRLASESSPYLLQHADNPVDWYPWGPEALERARTEDRPILLSIGYSACHWCHVMERESFEDPAVADLMNELFVNVKVDREERPDLDQIYMKAVQAMTGSGGWPMTVFLTPQGVPYFGGTYFPPLPRHGMPSFTQVVRGAAEAYRRRKGDVKVAGERLVEALEAAAAGDGAGAELGEDVLDDAARVLAAQYDPVHGGFGRAPKFPQPVTLELLLRHHVRTGDAFAREALLHTLRRMAAGGLRDHLAGGFHRYSVDERWLVPHFEKMLYDNALLARAYLDAYRATGEEDLRVVAEQTLDYMRADLRSPDGGFYAARDADSEGEEGLFYVWTPAQVEDALDSSEAALFMRCYDVTPGGNWEGKNILHLPHTLSAIARNEGMELGDLERRLSAARSALLEVRGRREPPLRDEKVLTGWTCMALRAFAEAGAALGRSDYVAIAVGGAELMLGTLRPEGRLMHVYKDGRARIPAFLEDFGALGNALLSIHEATLDARWLPEARWACEEILGRFRDEQTKLLYDTPADGERLVVRPRDAMDNATPSGNSLAAELLLRAGHLFDEDRYREAARHVLEREAPMARRYGPAFGRLLSVVDRWLAEPVEVAVIGPLGAPETLALGGAALRGFRRALTVAGRDPAQSAEGIPLLAGRDLVDGKPAAYVCRGYACRMPVTDPEAVAAELSDGGA